MKQIKTFSNETFLVTDEQAENVKEALRNGDKYLDIGEVFVALSSIKIISPLEQRPYAIGYPMTHDCRFVIREGEKKPYAGTKDQIEWREYIPEDAIDLTDQLKLDHEK